MCMCVRGWGGVGRRCGRCCVAIATSFKSCQPSATPNAPTPGAPCSAVAAPARNARSSATLTWKGFIPKKGRFHVMSSHMTVPKAHTSPGICAWPPRSTSGASHLQAGGQECAAHTVVSTGAQESHWHRARCCAGQPGRSCTSERCLCWVQQGCTAHLEQRSLTAGW